MHLSYIAPPSLITAPLTSILPSFVPIAASSATYIVAINVLYLARRSHLRSTPKREIFRVRTTRETGVTRRFHVLLVLVWQIFVLSIFPLSEPIAMMFGRTSFFFTYPNAHGVGIILEPVNIQHLTASQRAKEHIRFDWHRFTVNVGNVGRDGYRHPPSVTRNVPHMDYPKRGLKHWPWKRKVTIKK